MGKTSRKRKFFVLIGLVISIVLILLVAAPLWVPWILPPILKHYGAGYSRYEREGYSRIILHDAEFAQANTTFQAKRVVVLFPTTFLWRNFRDDRNRNYLRVSDWKLEIQSSDGQKNPSTNSVYDLSRKIDGILEEVNRWIPKAILDNGTIVVQDKHFSIPAAEWVNGDLFGRISSAQLFPEIFFNAHLSHNEPNNILIESPGWDLGGEITLIRDNDNFLKLQGAALWRSNRVDLAAQFGRKGLLPETASIKSTSFQIPAAMLKLEGYRDLAGSLELNWKTNRFTLDLTAQAKPLQNREIFLSPIAAVIHASGDTNSILIETARVSSPWLKGDLSKNVAFSFRGEMLSENATLNIAADLFGQKWIKATGQLSGEAILRRGTNHFPNTTFNLSGANIGVREIEMDRLDLQGEFNWPWLRIASANVEFNEGAKARADLQFNTVTREISGGNLRLEGVIGHPFLPPDIHYTNVALAAEFSGPLKTFSHAGHIELRGAKFPQLAPLGIIADWRGRLLELESVVAKISAKDSTLALAGSANIKTNQIDLRIENLVLSKNEEPILNLEKPFSASATNLNRNNSNWTIAVEPLRWAGNETEISLAGKIQWPQQGNFSASVKQLAFTRFRDFFEHPLPEVFLDKLNASAHWNNGPATFSIDGSSRFFLKDNAPFSAEFRGSGNEEGISIETANVGAATESIVSGKGFLPLAIIPSHPSNLVQILPKQRIEFQAETIPNTQFWEQLAKWTQTDFRDPRVSLLISGTFDAPQGKITASIKEILLRPKDPNEPLPRLQNLLADFDLTREQITLNRFEVFVEGQPVTASGTLPLPKNLQTNWAKIFDWHKANVDLQIVEAQIAPFERLFPNILSPLGTVNLDLAIVAGKMNGELRVADAALRPIPSLGPVHDIAARVKFLDEQVTLESFSGNIGGQPVNLTGQMNLAKRGMNGLPEFNFKLRGTNVPLSRSPDLILRSDLDLAIANQKGGEPLVSGTMNLRDSFYLGDLKLLVPGRVARPKERPPYFSVETQPFAKWRLDVAVRGVNFLRIRSPLFRGEISANMKLSETLREPVALGDVSINSGVVQFPFANLRVTQGFISLTSENPFQPRLTIAASTRAYGYEVQMDVSGFAEKPVIEFSSNPGLTSEQILLMVTAGELPRDDFDFSSEQKAGRLAFFLGKNLISKFGTTDARDDKLEIRSGENVSEQGQQTYYLEYKLTDDWSIIGEYDRFGGINAGFKWKFFEK